MMKKKGVKDKKPQGKIAGDKKNEGRPYHYDPSMPFDAMTSEQDYQNVDYIS